ncbi:MAG: iron ABC transporter permease [Gaiellaceae bacterium]|nr:MAG: iron ABC transporter permease [Gaiellaceae bacterium]
MSSGAAAAVAPRGRRPPWLLLVAATLVALAAVLPLAYLALRALSADAEARALTPAATVLELVADTALLAGGVLVAALLVGVPYAWLVVRTDLPGRRLWGLAASLPLVVPSFVAALALLGALAPRGLVQRALGPLGVERLPDLDGYWGATLALTLSTYPYVFLLAASALRSVDPSAEEAARGLGSGTVGVFARVTLPSLRPALAAASLLVTLYVLSDFGAVSLMGYETLTTAVYVRYESLLALDSAAILALVLVALAVVLVLVASRLRLRGAIYRATPGAGRQARLVRLGHWRWPALGFCALVTGLFLVLPLAVLVSWSLEADPIVGRAGVAWAAAARSTAVAGLAALVAALIVLPAAVLAWRYPSPLTRLLERVTLFPSALPGIAVALALVFFGSRAGSIVYQSLGLLLAAYVLRFMPYALASTRASLDAINPHLEEAARSLGRRPTGAVVSVVLPLARSGILAGAALVFLSTIKELPVTLLLRPIGFETLATEIWKGTAVGAYSEVAPSALALIAIAAPFVYLLSWRNAWELGAAD